MYLITTKRNDGSEAIIWKYKNEELALKDYTDLKKRKYKNLHLSKVIK